MIDVVTKRCLCGKHKPLYNEPEMKKPICCSKCKSKTMVDVVTKKCRCGKHRPSYNEQGLKIPICCSKCRTETMINVVTKRCKGQDGLCPQSGNKKYNGYCTYCFAYYFPNDLRTMKLKFRTKENKIRDFINNKFGGFIHDKPLFTSHCDCTIRRRVDHRKLINGTLLAIETDENQHKTYDKMNEETRYNDLYMAFSGKWIYIRFNPDKYKSKNGKNKNTRLDKRLEVLGNEIAKQIDRIK